MSEMWDEYTANKIKRFWGGNSVSDIDVFLLHRSDEALKALIKQLASERALCDELAGALKHYEAHALCGGQHKEEKCVFKVSKEVLSKWKQARSK